MPNFKDLTVLCWDNGLFVHVAIKLAETFGRVLYGTPYVTAFPKSNNTLPGDGLPEITRIIDFWKHKDEADLIVFPDVMFADMQEECVQQGKRVFGSRYGEELELRRWGTKQLLQSLDMPVAESHLITGMAELREFLKARPGMWWIKTDRYRGDFETFESEDYDDVLPKLDELESSLGRKALVYKFVVEANIPAVLEVGYDGHTIDGQFPKDNDQCLFGIEAKDLGYVGIAKPYGELPEAIRWVNDKISPWLEGKHYRGLFSSEIRITDEVPSTKPTPFRDCPMLWNKGQPVDGRYAFLTDPCCRAASPPSELYMEWVDNWDEIMWEGAEGMFVPVHPVAKYGVEIMLHSLWADRNWQPVRFPDEIKPYVKLRNVCMIDDVYSAVPQAVGLPEIGAVIGFDDDLKTAIKLTLERCAQVKGYSIEAKKECVQQTVSEIEQAQENGLEFTNDPLPSPDELEALHPE